MKKFYLFIAVIGLFAIMVSFTPALKKANGSNHLITNGIPDEVKAVFEKSCTGCHSDDGKGLAKAKLNFSQWDNYEPAKQAGKAAAICKMITKGKMPPKSIRKSKPDLIPTQQQIDLICKWSKTLGK